MVSGGFLLELIGFHYLEKYNTAMRPIPQMPSLASLTAVFRSAVLGLALAMLAGFACAQTDEAPPGPTIADIQSLVKQKQLPQALDKTEQYIAAKPKDAEGYFAKGQILVQMQRPAEAMAVFTKMIQDFPELPEPYNNLAVLYAQQKQYDQARAALEMAIRANPDYVTAHENLGDIYAKLASRAYEKAVTLDTANKTAPAKLSLMRQAIAPAGKADAAPPPSPAPAAAPKAATQPNHGKKHPGR